jgi:hypothetical protein
MFQAPWIKGFGTGLFSDVSKEKTREGKQQQLAWRTILNSQFNLPQDEEILTLSPRAGGNKRL